MDNLLLKSDWVNSMDHTRFSSIELSAVILTKC